MPTIVPAILAKTEQEFIEQLKKALLVSTYIQIDIADGKFVENSTWNKPKNIKKLLPPGTTFELHLMVDKPYKYAKKWKNIEGLERIIFHINSTSNIKKTYKKLSKFKKKISVALNPEIRASKIKPIIDNIQGIQFMTVHPGRQGNPFLFAIIDKIQNFHDNYPDIPMSADGGINQTNIQALQKAGITQFNIGSALQKGNITKNFNTLKNTLVPN
jgi:ribulose-phosphate 3-epimerase